MATSPRLLGLMSDERLVQELRRGNDRAFEAIYDRHSAGLLSFSRHLLGSQTEAEDALQQTFVSAYTGILADTRDLNLKPWLFAIARNRCLSMLRARRPEDEADEPSVAGLDTQVARRAELRELLGDLQRLPVSQRAALILSELRGFSHRDIGTVLECPPEKVKSLVFQARTHLLEYREARDTPCFEIRRELAAPRRGAPSRRVRDHLAACPECAQFRRAVRSQRAKLAALIPVIPAAVLRGRAIAAIGGSSGSAAAGGGGLLAGMSGVKAVVVAAGTAGALLAAGSMVTQHPTGATANPSPPGGARLAQVPSLVRHATVVKAGTVHRRAQTSVHNRHKAAPAHRRASSAPARRQRPVATVGVPQSRQHAVRRRHRHHVRVRHPVDPAPPAPPISAPQPAPTAQDGSDGQDGGRHGNHGRHRGRERRHQPEGNGQTGGQTGTGEGGNGHGNDGHGKPDSS